MLHTSYQLPEVWDEPRIGDETEADRAVVRQRRDHEALVVGHHADWVVGK
jgi:hypothetical protein